MAFHPKTYAEALAKKCARLGKNTPKLKRKKKTKAKLPKKHSVSKLHKLIWEECRRVKQREPANCYTCNATNLVGSNKQLGHGQSKGSLPLQFKYDLRNLKWQCFHCNINLQGCQELFLAKLESEEAGREFLHESSFKNIHGGWEIKKLPPINARDFLTERLALLELISSK